MENNLLFDFLNQKNIRYNVNVSASDLVSFKIGGIADVVVYPKFLNELIELTFLLKKEKIKYVILGNGTNTYFSDDGYNGIVISTSLLNHITLNGNYIVAQCGAKITDCAIFAYDHSLTGMEFASGIPGCIGGCVYMNASAFGGDISGIIYETKIYDLKTNKIRTLSENDHKYAMKHSIFMENNDYIILEASFKLSTGQKDQIESTMNNYMQKRINSQPINQPSAGSVFKRPKNLFAPKLIEEAGLKGMRIGDAMISTKHAGFIVNTGKASSSDVNKLIEIIKAKIKEKYKVDLEQEIIYIE